jgi:CarboxypepD_reg-like domain
MPSILAFFLIWCSCQTGLSLESQISGTVYDAGEPDLGISRVEVFIEGHRAAAVMTDDEGNYQLEHSLVGTHFLVATKERFLSKTMTVHLNKHKNLKIDFYLPEDM